MRTGMSPVLGFVLLLLLVIGMAGSASILLNQQQEAIENQLGQALEQDLEIESVTCYGDQIRMSMRNNGADLTGVEDTRITVIQGGTVEGDMINQTVPFDGAFSLPNSTGTLNASIRGTFDSGTVYTVRLTFPFGDYIKEGTCSGGYPWWNTDYQYRQQIRLTNDDQAITGQEIAFDIDTTDQVNTAKMRSACEDLQVVDDNETLETHVEDCGTEATTVSFPISLEPDEEKVSTYLYYGNPDARTAPEAPSPSGASATIDVGPIEEQ